MKPATRRILQAVLYETLAIGLAGPVLALIFEQSMVSALGLAAVMSTIALLWNVVFNAFFERWEARQADRRRSAWRRLMHGLGFEGGLVILLVPLVAYWLDISWLHALWADLGLFVFFFFYTIAFTWVFDRIFGLPQSARR